MKDTTAQTIDLNEKTVDQSLLNNIASGFADYETTTPSFDRIHGDGRTCSNLPGAEFGALHWLAKKPTLERLAITATFLQGAWSEVVREEIAVPSRAVEWFAQLCRQLLQAKGGGGRSQAHYDAIVALNNLWDLDLDDSGLEHLRNIWTTYADTTLEDTQLEAMRKAIFELR